MMTGVIVRPMQATDLPTLRQLYQASRQKTFTWETAETITDLATLIQDELVLIADWQGTIVGFIGLYVSDNFIHSLYVHPDYFGQGIGRTLLQSGLAQLGRPATLKCLVLNQAAVAFYQRAGWQRSGVGGTGQQTYYQLSYRLD